MSEVALNIRKDNVKDIRQLYDKYAGMLLGFIRGTVQDHKRSEEHLIKIISAFAIESNGRPTSWLALRQYAQYKLIEFSSADHEGGKLRDANEINDDLTADERIVFQAVYYQKKSISQLASLLHKKEDILRTQLKSSVDKIRKARGN
ncbi:hypothetical protein [Pedobacter agri]|uniref:hypothetical protein n=1 Tax=Pedobacter agri TaxID=454586 RepID=UPI002930FBAD|nr:hypothetical protein [Pedobacter agri]